MSRHRNVRNLTEDDYYDDYDDYDDYYEEEDDDYYHQQQQERQRREKEEAQKRHEQAMNSAKQKAKQQAMKTGNKPQTSATKAKGPGAASTNSAAALSEKDKNAKERLLQGMGFSAAQAKTALSQCNWDVQRAADFLVTSTPSAPPPGFSTPKPHEQQKNIVAFDARPPPGLGTAKKPTSGATSGAAVASISSSSKGSTPKKKSSDGGGLTVVKPKKKSAPSSSSKEEAPAATEASAPPPPQLSAKLLESIKSQRSRLSMVVLGHVDAGKSTLMGQVLLQLGHIEKRTVTKYQRQAAELGKASFALAWVMDEDDSERERGVTMEIGTKYATTPNHDLTILDAPGHADFVPAMITGAASADTGLLVVAATTGEFEAGFELGNGHMSGGQTREHIILSRGLGVSQLIVAVNKLDAAEPPWSKERFDHIKSRLMPFLQANGFNLKRVRFVPVSGLTGVNVKDGANKSGDSAKALTDWYQGPTLLEAINDFVPAQRNVEKPLRLIVSDVYAEGKGIVARGRVTQGILQVSDKVVLLPIGDAATVSRIDHGTALVASSPYSFASSSPAGEAESLERKKVAVAGDSVDVVLSGVDIARISPGCVLSHTHLKLRPPVKKKIQAKVLVMDKLSAPIIRGAQVLLHMHSIDVPAVITKLVSSQKRDSTPKDRPRVLTGGSSATVEITMHEKICMEEFSECRSLGRFVLRRGGDTIAVGVIENILD